MNTVDFIIEEVVYELAVISGIEAVVLGGSRAKGVYSESSDIDIGIYYNEHLDLEQLNKVATKLDSNHRPSLVSPIGSWGPWVNAGAWLNVDGYDVDLILRDINRVASVLEDCKNGEVFIHYQPGHPHGFYNVMYIGELAVSKLLWKKYERISSLKNEAENYPEKMKQAIINYAEFEAGFSINFTEKSMQNNDLYYISAHVVRALSQLNQLLFAINNTYCLNEKRAVEIIEKLPIRPPNYREKVDSILAQLGHDTNQALITIKKLYEEVVELK